VLVFVPTGVSVSPRQRFAYLSGLDCCGMPLNILSGYAFCQFFRFDFCIVAVGIL
jgi:hypothetical protein